MDNASTDRSGDVARAETRGHPNAQVLVDEVLGKSHALNTGRAAARGEFLALLDADDEIEPDYLVAMVAGLRDADLVGGRCLSARFTPWAPADLLESSGLVPYLRYLPSFNGASMGVRAVVYDAVGGFDTSLRSAEDVDFSWRVQEAGFRAAVVPEARLIYRRPTTPRDNFLKARSYGRSHVWLFERHRSFGQPRLRLRDEAKHVAEAVSEAIHHEPHWGWRAAWHLGLVEGRLEESLRRRVWYP